MRIQYLTFTGADDETPIQELVEISAEFPYVEWAILFGSKQGLGRYPSLEWVETLPSLQLSAHFCGSYVDRYTNGDDPRVHELFKPFKRYQFNMTGARLKKAIEAKAWTLPLPHPVIYGGNYTGINTEALDDSVACLFDTSGGRGILTKEWPKPIPGVFCGYAGGLGPNNIVDELARIEAVVGNHPIWIDMESSVRKNDRFCLKKVRQVLELTKNWF